MEGKRKGLKMVIAFENVIEILFRCFDKLL